MDKPTFKSITFDIKDTVYQIQFGEENLEQNKSQAQAAVQSCDLGQITRNVYHSITALSLDLPHEWFVAAEKQNILKEMKQMVSIYLINLIPNDYNKQYNQEIHITDCEIIQNI